MINIKSLVRAEHGMNMARQRRWTVGAVCQTEDRGVDDMWPDHDPQVPFPGKRVGSERVAIAAWKLIAAHYNAIDAQRSSYKVDRHLKLALELKR